MLSVSNDVKHIVVSFLFNCYHKMVSPQNGDTRGGPPPPPVSDATVHSNMLKNKQANRLFLKIITVAIFFILLYYGSPASLSVLHC